MGTPTTLPANFFEEEDKKKKGKTPKTLPADFFKREEPSLAPPPEAPQALEALPPPPEPTTRPLLPTKKLSTIERMGIMAKVPSLTPPPEELPAVELPSFVGLREEAQVSVIKRITGKSLGEFSQLLMGEPPTIEEIQQRFPGVTNIAMVAKFGAKPKLRPQPDIEAARRSLAMELMVRDSIKLAAGLGDFLTSPEGLAAIAIAATGPLGAAGVAAFYATEQGIASKKAIEEWALDPRDPDKIEAVLLTLGFTAFLAGGAGKAFKGHLELKAKIKTAWKDFYIKEGMDAVRALDAAEIQVAKGLPPPDVIPAEFVKMVEASQHEAIRRITEETRAKAEPGPSRLPEPETKIPQELAPPPPLKPPVIPAEQEVKRVQRAQEAQLAELHRADLELHKKLPPPPEPKVPSVVRRKPVIAEAVNPAVAEVLSQINRAETSRPGASLSDMYTATKDALHPIRRAVEGMEKGRRVPTEENAYELSRLFAGWWGKADHFLERGTFNPNNLEVVTGKSLTEVLRPVQENLDNFRAFLAARRTLEKSAQGMEVGIRLDAARETVKSLDSKTFQKASRELYEYQDSLLAYQRDSGMLSPEQFGRIRALNRDYVPFFRLLEEAPRKEPGVAGKTFADLWVPVKRMKGGKQPILDPLESIVKNTYTLINLAERNRVGQALTRQAERSEGGSQWVEAIPAPKKPTTIELREVKKSMQEAGVNISKVDLDVMATIFRPETFRPRKGIIAVFENGKRSFFRVQPDLYRAMKGLDGESMGLGIRLLSMPARALRLGATGISPEFVIRNPIRDTMTAFMQSKHGFKPGVDTARGLFHALKRDDLYWEWKRGGGEQAAMVSMDRTTLQRGLADMMRSNLANAVRHPIEALRIVSEMSEAATRLGEFQLARKAGETIQASSFASREVALDFARMGAKTRAMNAITAFWNAALEGTDKFVSVHLNNPKGTVAKATVGITLPSLLLYAVNRDDPLYHEQPWWRKDFFWLIPTKGTPLENETPFIPIPKPFLWGIVYGAIPERTMQWIDKNDPSAFDDLLQSVGTATIPSMIPTGAIPIAETWANRSLLTGQRLEPRSMEKVHPQYRAHPYTTEFSKQMAKAVWKLSLGRGLQDNFDIEISPIKLDQAIFSVTGGAGRAIIGAPDPLLRPEGAPEPPAGTMADIPGVRAFALRWPTGQAQSIQGFYDRLNELETKKETAKYGKRYPGTTAGALKLTPQEGQELLRLKMSRKQMGNLSQKIRKVSASTASPEIKREKIDKYMLQMLNIARKVAGKPKIESTLKPPPEEEMLKPPPER